MDVALAGALVTAALNLGALEPGDAPADPPAATTDVAEAPEVAPATAAPTPSAGPADTHAVGVVEEKPTDPLLFPDPRKFSRGFFAEVGVGPGFPIGPTRRVLSTAFSFSAHAG